MGTYPAAGLERQLDAVVEQDCTSANQTYALPALSTSNDGHIYHVYKYGAYKLTIQPNGTDAVGDSGAGYGVESMDEGNAGIILVADNSASTWHIMTAVSRWCVEGLKFYQKFDKLYKTNNGNAAMFVTDEVASLAGQIPAGLGNTWPAQTPYGDEVPTLDLASGNYVKYADSARLDVFGSLTDDWTISLKVKHDDTASAYQVYLCHWEDTNNRWNVMWNNTEKPRLEVLSGGTQICIIEGANTITDTNWHQIDVVKVDDGVALYVDGVREGGDTLSSADTFAGDLYVGQFGSSSGYFNGQIADFCIVNQNLYGIDPTSGSSTTPVRTKYPKLIYGAA